MSLDHHRQELLHWLQTADCLADKQRYGYTMALIKRWWEAYKAWEADETFMRAFIEERLSVTQRPWTMKSVPGKDVNLNATSHADPRGPKMTHGTSLQYRTDVASLKQRLDPANFRRFPRDNDPTQVRRMKYELGIHDMSASLLDPAKGTISEQLRWKLEGKGKGLEWAVVLLPLPKTQDLAVFELLKDNIKPVKDKVPTLYRALSFMRNRMTRVKFAQETDMGATFLEKGSAADPHLRYGANDVQSEKNASGILTTRYVAGISTRRRSKAREYNTILAKQRELGGTSNEIVVAYRQHASPKFPIVGIPYDDNTWYQVQDGQAAYYRNATILDKWRDTVMV